MKTGRETNQKEHVWRLTSWREKKSIHVSLAPPLALGPKAAQKELISAVVLLWKPPDSPRS